MNTRNKNDGTVLLICLILSVLVMGLMAAGVTIARTTGSWFEYTLNQSEILALAEAATELRQKDLLDEVADFADDQTLLGQRVYTVTKNQQNFSVTTDVVRQQINGTLDNELVITDPDGVTAYVTYYHITGQATIGADDAEVTRTIQVGRSPLFQFCVFYADDLEVLPGPNMTLAGRVHANGDVYLNSGATLTIDSDYLRCTGELFRGRKNDNSAPTGTVRVKVTGTNNYASLTAGNAPADRWDGNVCNPEFYGNYGGDPTAWVTFADNTWGGTIQTQAHGTKEVAAPQFPTLDPGGHFNTKADLVVKSDGSIVSVYQRQQNGTLSEVTNSLPAETVRLSTVYDHREGQNVSVVEVDMAKLQGAGYYPPNGLLYAFRTDTTDQNPNGILFKNAKELPQQTFLASPDPVYVQGDFNAPAAGSNATKQAAMVMCDALNILSNAWNGSKTAQSSLPDATPTEINLAMISGNVATPDVPDGSYSGGLENYPRLHEDWGGVELKIRGSFINLFESRYARGQWTYGGRYYQAPGRNWGFDPDLLNHQSSFLKNIIPFAVYARRVAWNDNLASRLD